MKLQCRFKLDRFDGFKKRETGFIDGYLDFDGYPSACVFFPDKRKIIVVDLDDLEVLGYSEIPPSTVPKPFDCDCGGECVQEAKNEQTNS